MALRGIKVLEFEGLAPVPYCGMILSDFGADVIRIDRPNSQFGFAKNYCGRGKRSLSLNLKNKESQEIIYKLIEKVYLEAIVVSQKRFNVIYSPMC